MKQKTRGAPEGNKNAAGKRGRKEYVNVFGQRWSVEVGNKIVSYLTKNGITQKQFLEMIVDEYILNETSG